MFWLAVEEPLRRAIAETVPDFHVECRALLLVPGREDAADQLAVAQRTERPAEQRIAPFVESALALVFDRRE